MTIHERGIRQPDRLVSVGFIINPKAELRARMRENRIESGYPPLTDRIKMTALEIEQWITNGMDYRTARKDPSHEHPLGINAVFNHPNRLKQIEREKRKGIPESQSKIQRDDGEQVFPPGTFRESMIEEGYLTDSRGVPVHPYSDILLTEGAAIGPGFYWNAAGPTLSASAVIPGMLADKLYIA